MISAVTDSIFVSQTECGSDTVDFLDGHPSTRGPQPYSGEDLSRGGLYGELLDGLGVPTGTGLPAEALFWFGSGILDSSLGHRLDCGCGIADCAISTEDEAASALCMLDVYYDQDDVLDLSPDQTVVNPYLKMEEQFGAHCYFLDGAIPSLLEVS
jgi:hypothetical protein